MKTSFLTAIIICLFTLSVNAQHMHGQPSMPAMKETKKAPSSLSKVLPLYYDISNALANGDADKVSSKAYEFVKAINDADMNEFAGEQMKVFMDAQKKLADDARKLVQSREIEKQRSDFVALSNDMTALLKGARFTTQPVYVITCSMKNASWLNNSTEVKNPYLGKQMLTCGKVTETIN